MTRQHELDARFAQGFNDREIFLAGQTENALDAFVFQRFDKKVRSLGRHWRRLQSLQRDTFLPEIEARRHFAGEVPAALFISCSDIATIALAE